MDSLFPTLFYPGVAFVILYSFFLQGLSRKIIARMQNRVGPPLLQPFYDVIKLMNKEELHFRYSSHFGWLILAFASSFTAALIKPSVISGSNLFYSASNLILVVYLLGFSYLALMFAGAASRSVYSEVGGARGIVQFISFEIVFLITTLLPAIKLGDFHLLNLASRTDGLWYEMPLFAISFILAVLPQVNLQPFNIPNAHREIVAGYATEFSGMSYGMTEMTHWFKLFTLISLFGTLYLGGMSSFLDFVIYSISFLFLLLIIRAAMTRTRIATTAKFYLILAVILFLSVVI